MKKKKKKNSRARYFHRALDCNGLARKNMDFKHQSQVVSNFSFFE